MRSHAKDGQGTFACHATTCVNVYHFGCGSAWVLSHGSISLTKNVVGLDYLFVKVRMTFGWACDDKNI